MDSGKPTIRSRIDTGLAQEEQFFPQTRASLLSATVLLKAPISRSRAG